MAVVKFFLRFFRIFRALPGCPGVERQLQLGSPRGPRVLRHRGLGGGADAGSFSHVSGHQSCACKLIFQPDRAGVDRHMR